MTCMILEHKPVVIIYSITGKMHLNSSQLTAEKFRVRSHVSKPSKGKQNKSIKASFWSLSGKQPINDSEKKNKSNIKPNRHNTTRIVTKQHSPKLA